jgi:type I restriction enzyme M protein
LDLPSGTFLGAGVKTVVLFFKKGTPTKKIWYYQLNLDRNLGKTNPLNKKDLAEFIEFQKIQNEADNSWVLDVTDLEDFDLSVRNPNKNKEALVRDPKEILNNIYLLEEKTNGLLAKIGEFLS